jgi:hypothetical protein
MPFASPLLKCSGTLFVLLTGLAAFGADRQDRDAGLDDQLRQELRLPLGVPLRFVTVATSKDQKYTVEEAKQHAPDIVRFEACHVGQQRVLFKISFAREPVFQNSGLILYADLDGDPATGRQDSKDHRGVDLMVSVSGTTLSVSHPNATLTAKNAYVAGARVVGSALYLTVDAPLKIADGKVRLDLRLLAEKRGGRSDSTPRATAWLPHAADRDVPKVANKGTPDLRPLSDYRYHDDLVKLERLKDKGLTREQVTPAKPTAFGRSRPPAPFATEARKPGQRGSVALARVSVGLLEEAGVARSQAAVRFGLPLAQGSLFDLDQLRLLSPNGEEVPAQFTATSFWPDDSLKWVLVDFTAPLTAKQKLDYQIEFGSDVKRAARKSPLEVDDASGVVTVVTGPLKVEIDKQRFNLLRSVWYDGANGGQFDAAHQAGAFAQDGARLVDEHGKLFTVAARAPESVRIEEQGPRRVVVRVEGAYAAADGQTYMRYLVRLVFRAGSPRVDVIYTHINDYLETEFTDVTSLTLALAPGGTVRQAAMYLPDDCVALTARQGQAVSLVQLDDKNYSLKIDGQESRGAQSPGIVHCSTARGGLTAAVRDFWQRWPKALRTDGEELRIEILPKQPGPEFGRGLPHYLLYPFVEGFYRFKWGMSFTEHVTLDFSGQASPAEISAEANVPVVAVLPADWYAQTQALGRLAVPQGQQFALWDKYVADGYASFLRRQAHDRTYGYFNYGDWYGERGRNWGNNEYDFAHAFFLQFARTGNRDYFRSALAAARHQADVDCVHAYPDPYYVGANHQHSIGHTGMWTERPSLGTWSWRYDSHTAADGGHVWADGMVDAWHLTGEAPVMDSALALAEHIAWGMSREFKALGTHERSAGWSLKAILAIYRSTYDPLYLDAARRIATVALREQKFDDGGAWPHFLPEDHAGGHAGARGNAIFLIAVLLGGLKEYHEVTGDPAVAKSIVSGAGWLLKCWDENVEGWPYTASVTGEPYFKASPGNLLAVQPLAYAGILTGDAQFIRVAQAGLAAAVRLTSPADGKSIAFQMTFTSDTLALLQQWYATHEQDKGATILASGSDEMAKYLAKAPDAEGHSVRAPIDKVFLVRLRGDGTQQVASTLVAVRTPHGAMPTRDPFGTIRVLDSSGAVVKEGRFSTDDGHQFECPLQGPPGTVFKVAIHDDLRGVWSLNGERLGVVAHVSPGYSIGEVRRARFYFFVPKGTREFCIKLHGAHPGMYAGVVLSPTRQVMGVHQGLTPGRGGITPKGNAHPEQGTIRVRPAQADTGKVWSLALMAAGNLGCALEGVPPYLAIHDDVDVWPDR